MPNCPRCSYPLALAIDGAICPNCHMSYYFWEVAQMKGYDEAEVYRHHDLLLVLMGSGLLRPGCNSVELYDDGMIITFADNED